MELSISILEGQLWNDSQGDLKRCFSNLTSGGHMALQSKNIHQKPEETLRLYRYSKIHQATTSRDTSDNRDYTRSF